MDPIKQARLQKEALYWQAESQRNEVERRGLAWLCLGGLVLSLLLALWRWEATAWGLGVSLLVYVVSMYMTWVRRGEFRQNAQDARVALAEAEMPASPPPATGS